MSRAKTISELSQDVAVIGGALWVPSVELGRAYDAGYLEGSGQSPITALEREVLACVLDSYSDHGGVVRSNAAVERAVKALTEALEREATE